jgi:HTH-type transcriptional regulator/antitoxin HigA
MRDARAFLSDCTPALGGTIVDLLEEGGWSQQDLAARAGFTLGQVGSIVRGEVVCSRETAEQQSIVLGRTTQFWLAHEATHRAGLEHQRLSESQRGGTES